LALRGTARSVGRRLLRTAHPPKCKAPGLIAAILRRRAVLRNPRAVTFASHRLLGAPSLRLLSLRASPCIDENGTVFIVGGRVAWARDL